MQHKKYWFSAKTFGWGWGLPLTWQGWVVYSIAFALLAAGSFLFPPRQHMLAFQVHTWGVVAVLLLICWLKGEPPRWRWR